MVQMREALQTAGSLQTMEMRANYAAMEAAVYRDLAMAPQPPHQLPGLGATRPPTQTATQDLFQAAAAFLGYAAEESSYIDIAHMVDATFDYYDWWYA
eukprot:4468508-Prorocentrum_lima.AAC.1